MASTFDRNWVLLSGLMMNFMLAPASWSQQAVLDESIARQSEWMWSAAQQIWEWAEPGYQEHQSSELIAEKLANSGFRLEHGIAEIPTAFTAEFGSGEPVIAIMGEYDALPGLSQTSQPIQRRRPGSQWGHGCGHHLFGVASAAAAIAVAEQIASQVVSGTVRYYGCPAEEGGSGKVFLVREGYFDDCAAALHWHPSSSNSGGDRGSLARIAVKFRFHGTSAHAASAPSQGRSSLDAVELTNHAVQLLREHVPDATRIHHVITAGGNAPNVVPDFAEVYYYIRHPDSDVVRELFERVQRCAQAGALATETRLEVKHEGGIMEVLPNTVLGKVALENLRSLNDLVYDDDDIRFASRIRETLTNPKPFESITSVVNQAGSKGRGSTDVGDVSWNVPTTGITTACWVPGTPGHSWQAVACGSQPMAKKGMLLAARVLSATAYDLLADPKILETAAKELQSRLGQRAYRPLMPDDLAPPLDYRNPPQR